MMESITDNFEISKRIRQKAYYSKEEAGRQLDRIADLIISKDSYVDTIQLLLRKPLTSRQLRKAGKLARPGSVRPKQFRRGNGVWKYRLLIQQPTRKLLKYIEAKAPDHAVNRFEIALDLSVKDRLTADILHQWVRDHLVQKWRGKRRVNDHLGTTYFARNKWTRRNFAIYSNRSSKITKRPCMHLELRIRQRGGCRVFGIESAKQVRKVNPREIWKKYLCFQRIDRNEFDCAIDRCALDFISRRGQRNRSRKAISDIMKHFIGARFNLPPDRVDEAPVQDFKDVFKFHECVEEIPSNALLP